MFRAVDSAGHWQVTEDMQDGTSRTVLRVTIHGIDRADDARQRAVAVRVTDLLNTHGIPEATS